MKLRTTVVLLCLLALPAFAAGADRDKTLRKPPALQPWAWTLEERLAARFDPESIRERSAAMDERNRAIMREGGQEPKAADATSRRIDNVIDGARNPELLTPTEVFHGLLFAFYDDARTRNDLRSRVARELPALGVSEREFWDELERVAGPYIDAFQFHTHGHPFTSEKELDEFCAMRFDALHAARQKFGGRAFDRLMYVAIAPTMVKGGEPIMRRHRHDDRSEVERQEGGCR